MNIEDNKNKVLESLNEMDSNQISLSESITNEMTEKSKRRDVIEEMSDDKESTESWIDLINKKVKKSVKKRSKYTEDDFDDLSINSKKKKKKTKDGLTNYDAQFDTELGILKNMYLQHNRFVDDLTKEYNTMRASKSSARGVSKYMTDLIEAITSARTVSMQVIKELIAAKKSIAELNIKEREKFQKQASTEQQDMSQYASSFMNEIFKRGRSTLLDVPTAYDVDDGNYDYEEYTSQNMLDEINDVLNNSNMDDEDRERELYLKYEGKNVTIYVAYDEVEDEYYFVAQDEDGNELSDYPLPEKGNLTINKNTGVATDDFGQRYPLLVA